MLKMVDEVVNTMVNTLFSNQSGKVGIAAMRFMI